MKEKTMKMSKNVLIVSSRGIDCYGAQISILNIIRHASGCFFTWYCPGKGEKKFMEEIRLAGVEIVTGGLDLMHCRNKVIHQTIARDVWKLCRKKRYDIIHVNTGLSGNMALALGMAWLCGVPCRIAHSRNSRFENETYIRHAVAKILISLSTTRFVACSRLAAEAMFGKKRAHDAVIFPNAIDLGKYAFSKNKRNAVRKELGITEEKVFGHVGVFNGVKNHEFLLNIFHIIVSKNNKSRLLLVGDGRLKQHIRQCAKEYGIDNKIIFVPQTDQVDKFLCAMDVFVFPSLYEGLPRACIEAQVSGLPCVVSDVISQEVKQVNNVRFLSLDLGSEKWADELLNLSISDEKEREKAWKEIAGTSYDLNLMGEYVEKLYEVQ